MLSTRTLLYLTAVAIARSEKVLVPRVKLAVHGATGTDTLSSYRTEAGRKLLVECAGSGFPAGTGEVTALHSENGRDTELARQEAASFTADEYDLVSGGTGIILPGGQWYHWTPQISATPSSRLRCQLHTKNTNGTSSLVAEDSVNVTVVFPPQPLEDLFVAVANLTAPLSISLPVLANPALLPNTVVWEPAGDILQQVRPSSPVLGYSVSLRQAGEAVTEVELSVVRVMEGDLGVHTVTVGNGLGSHTYKVRLFKPRMAEVFIGEVSEEIVASTKEHLVCRSLGGNPPPQLEAKIVVNGRKTRNLKLVEDDDGSMAHQKKRIFLLNPRVKEWSENGTVAVCVGVQKAGGKLVYNSTETRSPPLRIVYPPQDQDVHYLYTHPNETVSLVLSINAFPPPNWSDVVWEGADTNPNYKLTMAHPSPALTEVTLTVLTVEERDFENRQTITVRNEHGETHIYVWIAKPTPVWVVITVSLAVLVGIGLCIGVCAVRKKSADTFSPAN